MSRMKAVTVAVVGVAGLLLASAASAAITTSYAGTNCVREITSNQDIIYQNSRATNLGGGSVFYACPAIQQGGVVTGAKVSGRDLSASAGVRCHIEARDPFDMSGSFGAAVSTGNAFMGNYTLTLPVPAATFTDGSKVVHCMLPAGSASVGSAVSSYVVTEL
jgi:hypothetical protein